MASRVSRVAQLGALGVEAGAELGDRAGRGLRAEEVGDDRLLGDVAVGVGRRQRPAP